jgi:hypothetical protein
MGDLSTGPASRRRVCGLARRAAAVAVVAAALPMVASAAASAATSVGRIAGDVATTPTNCVPDIGVCGYPDAETSGVPGTVVLQEVPNQVSSGPGWTFNPKGYVEVTGNGADLTDLLIPYDVVITASNVTLQDDLITQGVITGASLKGAIKAAPAIDPAPGASILLRHTSDVTIEDTTIDGLVPGSSTEAAGIVDLYGDSTGLQIEADNIADTSTAVEVNAGTVSGNYIHSEMPGADDSKIIGIESNGGSASMTIDDNTVLVGTSVRYAIGLFSTYGTQSNKTIENNILAGGNYELYGGYNGGPDTTNIVVTNNRFSRYFFANGGLYGPVAHWDAAGSGNVWSGNFWDDTLAPIPEP